MISSDMAGKIEMVMDMYNTGYFCKCPWFTSDDPEYVPKINHQQNCAGRDQVRELLGFALSKNDNTL